MARFNFSFTGELGINGLETKNPYTKSGKGKTGKKWTRFGCSIAEAKNNRAFCELMGSEQDVITTYDTENNKCEVSWDDRFDPKIIKTIASYRKHIVSIDDSERHEFITDYDFVTFLSEHAEEMKGKRYTVSGQVKENIYNGTISQRFEIQNIYPVGEDVANKLSVTMDFYWTTEDYDFADFKSEKKIYINGYVNSFIDKNTLAADKGVNKYVPQQIIFDMSKIDWENERHCQIADYKLLQLGVKRDGEKLSTCLKKKKVYSLPLICTYVNGQETIEFDASTLTENQKMALDLGLKTLDDFKPKGSIYGERVVAYKVRDFILKDESADGAYDTEIDVKDFEDEIFVMVEQETVADIEEKVKESTKVEEPATDSELEDLFG